MTTRYECDCGAVYYTHDGLMSCQNNRHGKDSGRALSHGWSDWSVAPGHCEHAEDFVQLEARRVCGWKTGLCNGPCPSCPNKDQS
jgi:hypothetical protein